MINNQISVVGSGPHQAGDRVEGEHHGMHATCRVCSVHQRCGGTEYVLHTDPVDGGMVMTLNRTVAKRGAHS